MVLAYVIAWVPMLFLAILNAALREMTYGRFLGEPRANQISVFTGIALFWFYVRFLERRWPLSSERQALVIGSLWLIFTVAFELVFGHWGAHRSWETLFHEYNLLAGRLWTLLLAAVFFLPLIVYKATRIR